MPPRRTRERGDDVESNVDRLLESKLQQSAATSAESANGRRENRYYASNGRPVVIGPSKRKTYPSIEGDTHPPPRHDNESAKAKHSSVDMYDSYHPQSQSAQKRVRSNDWSTNGDGDRGLSYGRVSENHALRTRRGQDVSEAKERQERQSRFLEGSMNDKVSTQPPATFIGDEQEYLLSTYMDENGGGRGRGSKAWSSTHHIPITPTLHGKKASFSSVNTADTDGTDTKHSSSVFRFGKAIVSAFNPLGMWENVSEIWKGHNDSSSKSSNSRESLVETPHAARIQKAYEEYKASSAFRSNTPTVAATYRHAYSRESTASPIKLVPNQTPMQQTHRSYASIQSSTSKELPPTPLEWEHKQQHLPASSTKRSSFQAIKNSRSLLNLSQSLRKEHSYKDIAKENKLRKKVSNLEEKLMKYKRELVSLGHDGGRVGEESEDEAQAPASQIAPTPPAHDIRYARMRTRRFVPGALPSLPSERLLLNEQDPEPINEAPMRDSSPEKPMYTRKSEPRLRRTGPRIGEEVTIRTPVASVSNRATDADTPPSRKRKSPSPEPASIRRRRISTTYSKEIRSNNASPPPTPLSNGRPYTELHGPRPRPHSRNEKSEPEPRRSQPSRKAKENKYHPLDFDPTLQPDPDSKQSESRPVQTQEQAVTSAIAEPRTLPTPKHTRSRESVAPSSRIPPPIPSSTKPTRKQAADTNPNASADVPQSSPPRPRPTSAVLEDMITRPCSPKKKHNISPRRKANTKPITVTPGKNGDENIPPVPPLPAKHAGSAVKDDNQYEWPDDCF